MSIKVRDNLSSIVTSIGKNNYTSPKKTQVGRVYGVVTTENTPTKEMFEKAGGFGTIGTIFYLDYDIAKTITGSIDASFLESCKVAKPVYPQFQCYPLLGELVYLVDLPSSVSQVSNLSSQKYYITSVNLYNNQQQNSQPANNDASLGLTFSQNSDIRPLLPFEGDNITSARQGAALRFSTTTKLYNDLNSEHFLCDILDDEKQEFLEELALFKLELDKDDMKILRQFKTIKDIISYWPTILTPIPFFVYNEY
jgi:hypothetical protein